MVKLGLGMTDWEWVKEAECLLCYGPFHLQGQLCPTCLWPEHALTSAFGLANFLLIPGSSIKDISGYPHFYLTWSPLQRILIALL